MTATTPRYVGYSTLEGLLDAHEAGQPIFLAVPTERKSTETVGLVAIRTYAIVSDLGHDVCRFWIMNRSIAYFMGNRPLDDTTSLEQLCERAKDFEQLLREAITRRLGCPPQDGMISLPTDLSHLHGDTALLKYDAQAERYALIS